MRRVGGEEAWADETSFNKSPDVVCGVCPGPEYGALVTMTAGGIVVEAEVQTGRVLERCKAPGKAVANCICMHGNNLYAGMDDGRIREYVCGGVEDGGFQRCMFARQKSILCVSVSSDGSVLASGSIDNTTMIWNTATGQVMRHICAVTPSFPDIVQKVRGLCNDAFQLFSFFKFLVVFAKLIVLSRLAILKCWKGQGPK